MIKTLFSGRRVFLGIVFLCLSVTHLSAQTRTLRIAAYNIEDDISGATTPLPGLIAPSTNTSAFTAGGVVEGIGEEQVAGDPAQPLDVLALEETTSNPTTVSPICNAMNLFYNVPNLYTDSTYQATEEGRVVDDGNGPNAVVYNTHTLQLLSSHPVDPAGGTNTLGSASGEYREVMRYEFAPAGVSPASSNEFYIYVSHYKSTENGSDAVDQTDRLGEAIIIRTNEAMDLPATACVLYIGDYNVDDSGEAGYQTILSNTAPNGVSQGGGIDPLNVANNLNIDWSDSSTTSTNILFMLTEHGYNLDYRDDLQIMTTNVYYGAPGGLTYVPGTFHAFANNGLVPFHGTVDSGTNVALNSNLSTDGPVFISAQALYLDLTNASDHLPIIADYEIPIPAPTIASVSPAGTNLVFNVVNGITNGVYTVLAAPSLTAGWTPVATNIPATGNFTVIVTNAIASGAPQQFYLLQTR